MKRLRLLIVALAAASAGVATGFIQDLCGPFTDVSPALCPYVLEVYYLGITAGTSPTTYSPDALMTRGQAAVFVSKGVHQAIARSSRRAALGQRWTTSRESIGFTPLVERAGAVVSDGADLWVTVHDTGVTRVRASDGRVLETRSVTSPQSLLVAMGRVFVGAYGALHVIDPSLSDAVETVVSDPELSFGAMAFDGSRIWILNINSISIVTPAPTAPWPITTIPGFENVNGILFDGANVWVTAVAPDQLLRLDAAGTVIQTVHPPRSPGQPVFDGANLWVPLAFPSQGGHYVDVIQAATGTRIKTLSQPGPFFLHSAAFDGQRILLTGVGGISLWDAASLTPISALEGPVHDALSPNGVCSDGINFWIALAYSGGGGAGGVPEIVGGLARF